MSEFESFATAIADIGDVIEDARGIGGDASSAFEDEMKGLTSEVNGYFNRGTGVDLGLNVEALPDGEFQFLDSSGNVIKDFDKNLAEFKKTGDLQEFLRKVNPDLLNRLAEDPQAMNFLKEYKAIVSERVGQINEIAKTKFNVRNPGQIQAVEDIANTGGGNDITDAVANGREVTPEMVDEAVKDPEVAKQGELMADQLENATDPNVKQAWDEFKNAAKSKPAKFGKWVIENAGKIIVVGGIAAIAWMFYAMVKKHQNAMNGCWLVKKNGTKQKVGNLTCNKNDATNSGTGQIINNYNCSRGCPSKAEGMCDTGCESCGDANGGKYICVSGSFPEAAADMINNATDAGGSVIENLLKNSLKYIGLGILVVIAIIILVMIFQFLIKKATEKKGTVSSGVPSVEVQGSVKPSFKFRRR